MTGARLRLSGFEADAKLRSGCLCETLQGPGRGHISTTFQASNHRLCRTHGGGDFFLRHIGFTSRLDQSFCDRELLFQGVVFGDKRRVLEPLLGGVLNGNCFPAYRASFARLAANSISLRGVFCVFFANTRTTTTRRAVAVT